MMNVYMAGSGYDGCNYVRIRMPAYANGFMTDKKSLRSERDNMERVKQDMAKADIVVFHRPENRNYHNLARLLKKDGKKIVMDNDDTFYITDKHPLAELGTEGQKLILQERIDSINSFGSEIADMITCSTETLAEEYLKLNRNVVILPNCVDPDDWDEPLRNETDKARIGFVGSAAFRYDYDHIKGIIRSLSERDDVELVMIGLGNARHRENNPRVAAVFKEEYDFWDSIRKEHLPWVALEDYFTTLNEARLDLMLIPRKDNYFNRCKSNIKFLEGAMCEIPVVAQSFPQAPYEEIKDGETGFLIKDNSEWEDKINMLIKDKELRRRVGKNAHNYALKYYDINNNADKWDKAYQSLL